jgi:hypothetical protein
LSGRWSTARNLTDSRLSHYDDEGTERALEDARRSVRTTLKLRMSGDAGTATDSRPLVLERKR